MFGWIKRLHIRLNRPLYDQLTLALETLRMQEVELGRLRSATNQHIESAQEQLEEFGSVANALLDTDTKLESAIDQNAKELRGVKQTATNVAWEFKYQKSVVQDMTHLINRQSKEIETLNARINAMEDKTQKHKDHVRIALEEKIDQNAAHTKKQMEALANTLKKEVQTLEDSNAGLATMTVSLDWRISEIGRRVDVFREFIANPRRAGLEPASSSLDTPPSVKKTRATPHRTTTAR